MRREEWKKIITGCVKIRTNVALSRLAPANSIGFRTDIRSLTRSYRSNVSKNGNLATTVNNMYARFYSICKFSTCI